MITTNIAKKGLFIFLTLIMYSYLLSSFTNKINKSNYCNGWEDGYLAGYCYEVDPCREPLVPICPLEKPNENGYQDGYNRGFVKGKKDKEN